MQTIHKEFVAKAAGGDPLEYIMSDATVDRYGDVVDPAGWKLDTFNKNPIALFGHDSKFIVGHWANVRAEGGALRGRLKLLGKGISERLDEIIAAVDAGILRAVSVGFRPVEQEPLKSGGTHYRQSELVECSLVSIGANPNALAIVKALHLSDDAQALIFGKPADGMGVVRRGSPGKPADTPLSRKTGPMDTSQRIETLERELVTLNDQVSDLLNKENLTEDEDRDLTDIENKVATKTTALTRLKQHERNMAALAPTAPLAPRSVAVTERRPFAAPAVKEPARPGEYFMRTLVATVIARARGWRPGLDAPDPFMRALAERFGQDGKVDEKTRMAAELVCRGESEHPLDVLTRAVNGRELIQRADSTPPANTTTSGWASQLVNTGYADFLDLLLPQSVFPSLAARAMRLSFGRNGIISIPTRAATPTIAGSFTAEGAPIPVRKGGFTAQTFTPKSMKVISAFTREIAEHSTPAIETLIRSAMQEDTAVSLDAVLLDATAATVIRPAGIRAGVGAITASAAANKYDALVADLKALAGALLTGSNGNIRNPVWLMNPTQVLSIALSTNVGGDMPFKSEIAQNTFAGYPVIASGNVPAGTVILLDAADFAVIEGGAPRFDVSDQATLVFDDTAPGHIVSGPNQAGAIPGWPARSLWQTDSMAIRMILDVNWGFVRTGTIAWTQSVTW